MRHRCRIESLAMKKIATITSSLVLGVALLGAVGFAPAANLPYDETAIPSSELPKALSEGASAKQTGADRLWCQLVPGLSGAGSRDPRWGRFDQPGRSALRRVEGRCRPLRQESRLYTPLWHADWQGAFQASWWSRQKMKWSTKPAPVNSLTQEKWATMASTISFKDLADRPAGY